MSKSRASKQNGYFAAVSRQIEAVMVEMFRNLNICQEENGGESDGEA